MATLAEMRERAILRALVMLGESLTFHSSVGVARTVKGIPGEEKEGIEENQTSQVDNEEVWFLFSRDPAAAIGGVALGGIDEIETGDTILRAADQPNAPWSFQGATRNVDEYSWELRFARIRPTRYGPRLP